MYDILTTPRGPNPTLLFKAVQGPTIAKWKIHRSWRKREKEVYQDYRRFPWRGERQAQTDPPRTALLAAALDREMALVPASTRMALPPSGNYPVVSGFDEGPGPNPFFPPPVPPEDRTALKERLGASRLPFQMTPLAVGKTRATDAYYAPRQDLYLNGGNYEDGPESRPSLFAAPLHPPQPMTEPVGVDLDVDGEPLPTRTTADAGTSTDRITTATVGTNTEIATPNWHRIVDTARRVTHSTNAHPHGGATHAGTVIGAAGVDAGVATADRRSSSHVFHGRRIRNPSLAHPRDRSTQEERVKRKHGNIEEVEGGWGVGHRLGGGGRPKRQRVG